MMLAGQANSSFLDLKWRFETNTQTITSVETVYSSAASITV